MNERDMKAFEAETELMIRKAERQQIERPTCDEIATSLELWQEYADTEGHTTEAKFEAEPIQDRLDMLHDLWPEDCNCGWQEARIITKAAGGDVGECLDWLNDGDWDGGDDLDELIAEWREVGCTYIA